MGAALRARWLRGAREEARSRVPRAASFGRVLRASAFALALTINSWAQAAQRVLVVVGPEQESHAERIEEELHVLGYSTSRATETPQALEQLRSGQVDAVVVVPGPEQSKYYVLRQGEVIVETELEDSEHPEALPVKTAEGVRSTLRAEAERAARPAVPLLEVGLGLFFDATTYTEPRLGFEGTGLFRVTDRFTLGPRIRGTLKSDYGVANSELGASNLVLGLLGCVPLPAGPVVRFGLCASAGARAIFLSGLTGPQKGEGAGAIWGPVFGGAASVTYELSEQIALRSTLSLDLGFGAHSGPEDLPKRSTDLLAEEGRSSYFGLDVGLGFSAVYLLR